MSDEQQAELPTSVLDALYETGSELSEREPWVASRRSGAISIVPRVATLMAGVGGKTNPDSIMGSAIRSSALNILAYLPADLRLAALIDLAARNPASVDLLFSGHVSRATAVQRFNVLSSLGVFARHGLVEEVFTSERVDRAVRAVSKVNGKR